MQDSIGVLRDSRDAESMRLADAALAAFQKAAVSGTKGKGADKDAHAPTDHTIDIPARLPTCLLLPACLIASFAALRALRAARHMQHVLVKLRAHAWPHAGHMPLPVCYSDGHAFYPCRR